MEVDGHLETILCFLTDLSNEHPLILGFPWLRTHNPTIDWRTCEITFCSEFCNKNCFHIRPAQVRGGCKAPNPSLKRRKTVYFAETVMLRDCSVDDLKISSATNFAWFCRQKGVTISRITAEQLEQAGMPDLEPPDLTESKLRQILATEGSPKEHKAKLDVRYHSFVNDLFDKHFINRVTDKDIDKYLKDKKPATVEEIKRKLPADYHDLLNIFLPSKATKLPKHKPYDHRIDIEPSKYIPSYKTRPMSQSELRVTVLPESQISLGMAPELPDDPDNLRLYAVDTSEDLDDLIDAAYNTDPMAKKVVKALLIQRSWPKTVKRFIRVPFGDCELQDGRVFYHNKLFIPANNHLRSQIKYHTYALPASGHQGEAKTAELIKRHY
ncbi:Uu.00g006300.m01.CDS01 [Anthostomella pinea]|uniref:Uu.00g006300.m01.CDS01 n=1 Tax=Anthostomella pinea TaxID=933095 RepID=A0AAI8VKA5_9PEZI|nr:Uu.00g006300.m01.CDS01 [Anthostomella pinea]